MSKLYRPFYLLACLILIVGMACNLTGGAAPAPTDTAAPPPPADTPAPAQPTNTSAPTEVPATEIPAGLVTSLDSVQSAVIQIEAQGTFLDPEFGLVLNGAGRGSGFIIDPSGLAVTNNHVVTGAALFKIWIGGDTTKSYNAKVLGVSECSDLALIDIDGDGFPYVEWYNGDIKVGMDMYIAGFPLGDPEYSLSKGIISKANASGETSWASVDSVIEYDATSNPGNSGGPVINPDGQVLGIHYAGNRSTRQAFGISRDIALGILDDLKAGKNVDFIGINGTAVQNDDGSLTGIWVSSVQSGSPADKAGVKGGDIITMMENLVLATDGTMSQYCDILRSHKPGDTLGISVLRWLTGEYLDGQINGRELEVVASSGGGNTNGGSGGGTTNGTDVENPNASNSGDVLFSTEFDNPLNDWFYFLTNGRESGVASTIDNSRLRIEFDERDTYYYLVYDKYIYNNVRVDTRAENLGRNNNNVSLLCRYTDRGWYEFNIANNGLYWIYRYDTATKNYRLLASGGSNLIRTGQDFNEYTIICNGDQLTLGINGTEVKSISDRTLKEGQVGLSVSSFNVTPIIVEFDWFYVTVP